MADEITFATVTQAEWEQIPAPLPPKPKDRFDHLLASVGQGNIIKVELKEEKDIRGIRIAIARKARNRGFIPEFRNMGTSLYVKRSAQPLEEKPRKKKSEVSP